MQKKKTVTYLKYSDIETSILAMPPFFQLLDSKWYVYIMSSENFQFDWKI